MRNVKRDPKTLVYSLFPNVQKNVTDFSEVGAPKKQRASKKSRGRGRSKGAKDDDLRIEDLFGPPEIEVGGDLQLMEAPAEKRPRLSFNEEVEEEQRFQPYVPPRARVSSPSESNAHPTLTAVDNAVNVDTDDGFAPGELDAMLLDAARSLDAELLE